MKKNLLLFTIGPVQSYIAQARKTKDLFLGSYILSYLCKNTIEYLKQIKPNSEIIFPNEEVLSLDNESQIPSIPNRFLASVSIENDNEIYKLADQLEFNVKNTFKSLSIDKQLNNDNKDYEDQIEDFLEVYWASIDDNNNYLDNYNNLEKALGAIKNTRVFNQLNQKSGVKKCSICGQRNAIINKNPILQENEELCAICWTKRKSSVNSKFPSTAKISIMDEINKIKSNSLGESKLNEYINIYGNSFDEELLFEENLSVNYFRKNNLSLNLLNNNTLSKYKELKNYMLINDLNFTKYYALIALDGDDMGKWISGTYFKGNSEEFHFYHKKISKQLIDYNSKVASIITEPRGKIVYSGGDDVLAFVNLNYLFYVLNELRQEFPQFDNNKITTASCGVCIAHYKTPLHSVIKWARKAEKDAKNVSNKNALSIVILKRSGEVNQGTIKWSLDNISSIEAIQNILSILDAKYISPSFINKIQEEFRVVDITIPSTIVTKEIERLIKRSCLCKGLDKSKYSLLMYENIINLYNNSNYMLYDFFNWLNIIEFLFRRGD